MPQAQYETVTLLRRTGAMIYDTVLAGFSIVIVASIPFLLYAKVTGGELPDILKTLIYFAMAYGFFTWFWTHGGQTLGMRAWKIRVVGEDGLPINQRQASLRFFWSILSWGALGIGYLVSLTQAQHLAWHDSFSRTRLIRVR